LEHKYRLSANHIDIYLITGGQCQANLFLCREQEERTLNKTRDVALRSDCRRQRVEVAPPDDGAQRRKVYPLKEQFVSVKKAGEPERERDRQTNRDTYRGTEREREKKEKRKTERYKDRYRNRDRYRDRRERSTEYY